ncbi:glycoside hydrolase family 97 C-terminal domain-containing protein [Labilibaculum sp. K2S]|uniref:glycoside hydrolase family 97 C-terminal domain-containing protein n=1 Tax=Labilibaculum sp. K2S TaxID=3056386 RepID=UPI003FA610F1
MTNEEACQLPVSLSFLDEGTKYLATIYADARVQVMSTIQQPLKYQLKWLNQRYTAAEFGRRRRFCNKFYQAIIE